MLEPKTYPNLSLYSYLICAAPLSGAGSHFSILSRISAAWLKASIRDVGCVVASTMCSSPAFWLVGWLRVIRSGSGSNLVRGSCRFRCSRGATAGRKKKKGRGSKDPLTVHHTSEGAVVTDEYASLRGPLVVDSGTFLEVSVRVRVASREKVFVDALALRREGFVLLALGKLVTCGCKIRVRESLP